MQVFKTRAFSKFAKSEKINDFMLWEAVRRAEEGIIDADLGGHIIKQGIARKGQGRSKGYRVLIAIRLKKRYVFIDGFSKNEKDNIEEDELYALRTYGSAWLNADDKAIKSAIQTGKLLELEVKDEEKI